MRVLLDTNVILDFLLDREPFSEPAEEVWQALQQGRAEGYVSPITPGALAYQLDAIVTRDPNDFAGAILPVYSPADFLKELSRP